MASTPSSSPRQSPPPAAQSVRPPAPPPPWVEAIVAGLSTIPRREPIVDNLQRLRTFNEQVAYVSDLAATNYPAIQAALQDADRDLRQSGDLTQANVGQVNAAMHQAAEDRLGSGYRSYVRLKLQRVMDDVAEIVARTWAYPSESGQASFVRAALLGLLARKFPAAETGKVISPRDGDPRLLPAKRLMGAATHHFGAFFTRKAREHDYLWGRLDGVEQRLGIVAPDIEPSWYRRAFEAVLDEEGPSLPSVTR